MSQRYFRVKEVAEASGVTVRTLHHYDEQGLLHPSARSEKGYRRYTHSDLMRLQQILLHRELGFSLSAIRRILDDPGFDLEIALTTQREQILASIDRSHALLAAIDEALQGLRGEVPGELHMEKIFEGFEPSRYADEAEQRWGRTEAYSEAQRRTKRYDVAQWTQLKDELRAIMVDLAAAMEAGSPHDHPAVEAIVERHRAHIDRWFYPCGLTTHAGLAELYDNDPRFVANIDRYGAGLSEFLSAAVRARAVTRES